MSSGFVSGGTTDNPIERDDDWLKAQEEIETNRRQREEESKQDGGKTLYEVLQNNKAAKQEAFEESIKLKKQFRNLDEDEVEFLDSVLESTRAKEAAVRKETTEQLDLFRRQQEEADKALLEQAGDEQEVEEGKPGSPTTESQWSVNAKKRKRVKEKEGLKGVKLRKSSSSTHDKIATLAKVSSDSVPSPKPETSNSTENTKVDDKASLSSSHLQTAKPPTHSTTITNGTKPAQGPTPGLGLGGYSSDEDD